MDVLVTWTKLARGDTLTGFDARKQRRLRPCEGFSIGPSIYSDAVLTTRGGTARSIGGRRCLGFALDGAGQLWIHHGGRLSYLAINGSPFEPPPKSRLLNPGDEVEIRTKTGETVLQLRLSLTPD